MNTEQRATRAKRLRDDEAFQDFIKEVRADAFAQFENSGPSDSETRDDAHALLRAISKIEDALQAAVDAWALEQKKDQHRGSD